MTVGCAEPAGAQPRRQRWRTMPTALCPVRPCPARAGATPPCAAAAMPGSAGQEGHSVGVDEAAAAPAGVLAPEGDPARRGPGVRMDLTAFVGDALRAAAASGTASEREMTEAVEVRLPLAEGGDGSLLGRRDRGARPAASLTRPHPDFPSLHVRQHVSLPGLNDNNSHYCSAHIIYSTGESVNPHNVARSSDRLSARTSGQRAAHHARPGANGAGSGSDRPARVANASATPAGDVGADRRNRDPAHSTTSRAQPGEDSGRGDRTPPRPLSDTQP